MSAQRTGLQPTREGIATLLLTLAVAVAATITGNNLLYMVLAALLSLLVLSAVLGSWNLRGLEVARMLPAELFADSEGRGRLVLRNRRRWLPSVALSVLELDGAVASAMVGAVPTGEASVPFGWRFQRRGPAALGRIRISSAFPFGLARRWRDFSLPAELLVYPRPLGAWWSPEAGTRGHDESSADGMAGGQGDFAGLRDYAPGDSLRSIHWPTSARRTQPVVVQRTTDVSERVIVRVRDQQGPAWENELGRATGEVIRAFARGCEVGLDLPDGSLPPRPGSTWRRNLLDTLAGQPRRE